MNTWVAQQMAEQHNRDLSALVQRSRSRSRSRSSTAVRPMLEQSGAPMRSVSSTSTGAPTRRPVVPLFGNWLIKAGTRLGGATIRTS